MHHSDDLSLDFALGEISEEEFLAAATPEQVRQAQDLEQTLAQLGGAVAPLEPSAQMKTEIMERVRSKVEQAHNAPLVNPQTGTSPARTEAQRRWFAPSRLVAAGAVAAAAAAFGWGLVQAQQLNQAQQTISALEASAPASTSSLIDQISQASDMSFAQGSMGSTTFSVVYSPSHGMASISAVNLPQLPEGQVYMIWFYDAEGRVVGSGTLNHSGATSLTEMTTDQLSTVTDFGITVEEAGANSPSEKPMMLTPVGA